MSGGYDWQKVSAAGGVNNPAFLLVSGMTRQLVLTALESLKPPGVWFGASWFLTAAERDEIDAAVSEAFNEIMGETMFIGAVLPYIGSIEPSWGVFADGRTLQKSDYPALWEVSQNRTANDLTLPDYRDLFLVGAGAQHALGGYGGSSTVTLTEAQIPPHSHSYQGVIPNVDLEAPGVPDIIAAGINPIPQQTGLTGGGQPHSNEPQHGVINYVIVTPKP